MKSSHFLLLLLVSFYLSSCYKEPLTKGVITIYDEQGNTVSGVEVRLSQENIVGIEQSKKIRNFFKQHKIPIDKVISSHWCRCKETALIAF